MRNIVNATPILHPIVSISCLVLIGVVIYKTERFLQDMAIKEIGKKFEEKRYQEVLNTIDNEKALQKSYDFTDKQRLELFVKYQVESLAKTGRIKEAVILMATEMCSIYRCQGFPEELLKKWFKLYGSCEPIPVEEFYFCSTCGLHPSTIDLLDLTMAKGYPPPIGYWGSTKSYL